MTGGHSCKVRIGGSCRRFTLGSEINVMIPPVQAGYSLEVVMIMMTEPEVTENERRMGSEAARYGCSLLT